MHVVLTLIVLSVMVMIFFNLYRMDETISILRNDELEGVESLKALALVNVIFLALFVMTCLVYLSYVSHKL